MQFTPLSHAGASIPQPERFPPILYPPQSNVRVNPNRNSCPSDGFNYPSFRLINKSTRVYLSEPFTLDSLITYRPFAVANTKGWFAAVRKIGDAQDIIFSPLKDLRESIQKANEGDTGFFFPQRDLNLEIGLPTIVAFAQNDTRLLVGSDNGSIHVYDTAMLFSSGDGFVAPLHSYHAQYGALRQIAPNPGTEPESADKFAVVRSDGVVQLMNSNLESLGGWSSGNPDGNPVAVSWSPKGKHLAIGLRSGDILTFAKNNLSVPNKHLPAAVEGQLVGLNWLSPGHTFRVTYAPQIANQGESIQQFVCLDIKSNVLTASDTLHPFPMADRQQESHALILSHWDEDSISDNSKSLIIVGDRASSDIEILGGQGGQWFQQSQENPVSLPLDKQSDETTLMTLDLDLTDSQTPTPVVYAYLNDGSVQAWRLEHNKPYLKMITPTAGAVPTIQVSQAGDISVDATMDEKDAANVLTSLSGFATAPESDMRQQSSTFSTSAQPPSLFGQTSQPAFGQASPFGSSSTGSSIFGQGSTFSPPQASSSFFGPQPARHAFSDIATHRDAGNVFGGPSFGATPSSLPSSTQLAPDEMTREASMSDGTAPGFGELSLGEGGSEVSDSKPKTGIFGSFGPTPSTSQPATSAFGGPIRPAQGFGAFSNYNSATSTSVSSQEKPSSSTFTSTPHPAFGQTGFAKPSFGQPSFGQTGFAKPTPVSTAPASSNAFAAFASSPISFSSALQPSKGGSSTMGGFAAYASGGTDTFGTALQPKEPASAPSESATLPLGGAGSFGNTSSSGFASSTSSFGLRMNAEATAAPRSDPAQLPPGMMSPPSSPEPSMPSKPVPPPTDIKKEVSTPALAPATASGSSSSFIRQSTAFGGLKAMQETSPFFKKHDEKMPVTAFGDLSHSKPVPSTATPAFGAPSQLGATQRPVFGTTSQMGVKKSVFGSTTPTTTPVKPVVAGGFSTYSGPSSGFFGISGGGEKSFSDLLKSEDNIQEVVDEGVHSSLKPSEGHITELSTPGKPVSAFSTTSTPISTGPSPSDVSTTPQTPLTVTGREESTTPKTPTPLLVIKQEESTTPKTPAPLPDTKREESTTPKTPTTLPVTKREESTTPHTFSIDAKQEESTTPKTPSRPPVMKQESTTPEAPVPSAIKTEEGTTPKATPHETNRDASSSDLSVSSIGSFVDVTTDRSFDVVEEGEEGDDTRSFLSSDFSSEPSTDEEESEEEYEVDEKNDKLSEVSSRHSLSPTPQPEVPSVSVSPSPPADGAQTQRESTTPPGSPSMGPKLQAKSPSPTPASTSSSSSSSSSPSLSPSGIGLGRPSTRPARSSPLAAKPVSGEEEEEEGDVKETPGIKEVPRTRSSVSPKLPTVREESIKQEDDDATVRPKTPPLLSAFGSPPPGKESSTTETTQPIQIPLPIPAPTLPPVPVFSKPAEPTTQAKKETSKPPPLPESLQVPKPIPSAPSTAPVPFSLPPFSLAPKSMAPPSQPLPSDSAPAMVKPLVFARPEPPASSELPAGIKPSGFFGPQPTGVWGLDSHKGPPKTPQSAPSTTASKPGAPAPSQLSKPGPMTIERACFSMVVTIERELVELKELRDEVSKRYGVLTKAAGGSRLKVELGDRSKWEIADAVTFRQTMLQFEDDLVELSNMRETSKQTIRELNGNMLRANTRREEIARFNKAKGDKEFAKMLNTRSLGPEHLESQQHLRRGIRAARDRIQKMESHLQESKKKLSQAASGRPYIKAPSLDVINRTYRNIDMAIQQQNDEVTKLAGRVSKLKIGSQTPASGSRDSRLPDRPRRSIAITPHVAVTTAAALNAERSAHKLKKALLKVRKEPILNVRAASAPQPPSAFEASRRSPAASKIFESVQGPLFPPPEDNKNGFWDIDLNVPAEDKFDPGAPLPTSKRGASSNPKKHSSVSLKRTPSEASPPIRTSAADFWGTPPTFPSSKFGGEANAKVPFVPLTPPTPATPSPTNRSKSPNSLPGGGFEAFLK